MKQNELDQVLKLHALYLSGLPEGIRANLSRANLSRANLSRANLSRANLSEANLSRADLSEANLSRADLSEANLSRADLSEANLSRADLSRADLSKADLSEADLSRADLSKADLSEADLSRAINVPNLPRTIIVPEGELIVWKKVSNGIAKLKIPKDALRSNATTRKCRASYAVVLDCPKGAVSLYNPYFKYIKGRKVVCDKWEPNRWIECGGGIHFFLTKEEAEAY